MSECANAANAFCNVDELVVVLRANEALETTVNEADLGNGFEDHLVFDDKVIVYYNVKGGKQVSYIEMLESYGEEGCPGPDDDLQEDSGSSSVDCGPPSATIVEPVLIFAGGLLGVVYPRPVE